MEYDNIPDELEDNEIVIYEDMDGNIETDQYLSKEDAQDFKQFLLTKYKNVYYAKDEDSFDVGRPFRDGKPFVKKRSVHEVDWFNEDVIVLALNPTEDSQQTVKSIVALSGKVAIADSKATGFTLDARYIHLDKAFKKWKRENNKTETNESRLALSREFAKYHIAEEKVKNQKRVKVGTTVFCYDTEKEGKVIEYLEDSSEYRIETEDGTSRYKRKGFEVR